MHEPSRNDVDVVVIGAGAASLAATRSLLAAGCKVATGAAMREVLARPVADRLLFAGEACADGGWAATVAGAHRSGTRAAREALTQLQARRVTKAFAIAPKTSPSRPGDGGARHAQ